MKGNTVAHAVGTCSWTTFANGGARPVRARSKLELHLLHFWCGVQKLSPGFCHSGWIGRDKQDRRFLKPPHEVLWPQGPSRRVSTHHMLWETQGYLFILAQLFDKYMFLHTVWQFQLQYIWKTIFSKRKKQDTSKINCTQKSQNLLSWKRPQTTKSNLWLNNTTATRTQH